MGNNRISVNTVGRRFLFAALFAVVCAVACLAFPGNAYAKTYNIKTAAQWHNISNYKGGTFKVTKNIKLTDKNQYLTIRNNYKYTIDLNGHNVTTTYTGVALRSVCPLAIEKGTVTLKCSKKKGILYSTETTAVTIGGSARLYVKNANIVNDAVEFRSNMPTGIYMTDKSKVYLQGSSIVMSIGNGIAMFNSSSLSLTGHPFIRAGANNFKGQFTHYGSGINITSPSCKLSMKGGSIGTKASPPASLTTITGTMEYQQSGDYPIYDKNGKTLKNQRGYKFYDSNGNQVSITSSFDTFGANAAYYLQLAGGTPDRRLMTKVQDSLGYYTIYVIKN